MLDSDVNQREELALLKDADFPALFINMAHPDDYQLYANPVAHQFYFHKENMRHTRLIARLCWQSTEGFTTISFVCDTGAPRYIYLGKTALKLLREIGRIKLDGAGNEYIKILGRNVQIEDIPEYHEPANMIGLSLLMRLGLHVNEDTFSFGPHALVPL